MARFCRRQTAAGQKLSPPRPVASGHIFPSRPKTGVSRKKPLTIFAHLANPIDRQTKPDQQSGIGAQTAISQYRKSSAEHRQSSLFPDAAGIIQ